MIKFIGLGPKNYARDKFNLFDALLVILSLIEMILEKMNFSRLGLGSVLLTFRGIRLLRVFKLARNWTSFRLLLNKIIDSFGEIFTFSIFLSIFVIVFVILGLEFFANKVYFDANGNVINQKEQGAYSPQINMDNLLNAFIAVFNNLIGSGWNQAMYPFFRSQGVGALLYF